MIRLSRNQLTVALATLAMATQFFAPGKNLDLPRPAPDSLVVRHQAPPEVVRLLDAACNDCHSNHTRYPWYAEIQPVGWLVARYVRDGKHALNLSTFGTLGAAAQADRLQAMTDAIVDRNMPPTTYGWLHREARLTEEQIRQFAVWAAETQGKLVP